MRKFVLLGLAITAIALVSAPTSAQTNQQPYTNGIDYFFLNGSVPTDTATVIRDFGSATSIGNESGGAETVIHPVGVQQGGFQTWNGQLNATPPTPAPLGHSLMEFRNGAGNSFDQNDGVVVATASWAASLPCSAPTFWIVTFTWGTTYTQTSSAAGASDHFTFALRGETNQAPANQNYFTGSGNERNLNSGGISFFQDVPNVSTFQLIGRQEWSHNYFQVDGFSQTNRDPSAGAGVFGFDSPQVGTGGTILRSSNSTLNPGNPADGHRIHHTALQQIGAGSGSESVISLLSAVNFGGGLAADASGSFTLPAGDGRQTNLIADGILTPLALSLSNVLTSGPGGFGVGNVGVSGTASTFALDLAAASVPTGVQPLRVATQAIGINLPSFSFISSADRYDIY